MERNGDDMVWQCDSGNCKVVERVEPNRFAGCVHAVFAFLVMDSSI